MNIYPIRFKPVYQDYIWGGERIPKFFRRDEKPGIYAESWEVSDREEGMSVVLNGEYRGKTLHELMKEFSDDLIGERLRRLPLLIKLIDANQNLSVQVHPDDNTAKILGSEAKTEMWYILDAEENAAIYAGFKDKVNEASFRKALEENKVMDLIHTVPVSKGNVVFIPGGTVHAIGKGCLLLEIQQNSNTTYRVYDYDRMGKDGKRRPLHIEQAVKVFHWSLKLERIMRKAKLIDKSEGVEKYEVLNCPYFYLERFHLHKALSFPTDHSSFHIFFAVEGKGTLSADGNKEKIDPGKTFFIPAAAKEIKISPDPSMVVLKISLSSHR